jgi:hypothetical protein
MQPACVSGYNKYGSSKMNENGCCACSYGITTRRLQNLCRILLVLLLFSFFLSVFFYITPDSSLGLHKLHIHFLKQ